jgi:hypothetical protein
MNVAHMGEYRNGYSVLVGTSERKRPLGLSRHIWEDNIKMDLKGIGCKFMDWIHLAYINMAAGVFLFSWSNC